MKLPDRYLGGDDPFEGDRTLWLRSLPENARVMKATVTLTPKDGPQFQETFVLDTTVEPGELPGGDWGVTKTPPDSFIEVDFHARRTLAAVQGTQGDNIKKANLQVDMGGAYVGIADDGTFMTSNKTPWAVTLSSASDALPGLTVSKFSLSGVPQDKTNLDDRTLDITKVTIRSVPTNVSVRLGDMPPFWTRLGELVAAETSPDFAVVLNAFLAEAAAENGLYAVPFVVHSDTIARLDVELTIDYVVEQPILPPYLPEVTLPYSYSSLPGVKEDLLTVKLPRGATITGAGGAVLGTFDATRVVLFGEIGESGATATATVSPTRALAQPIQLDDETPVSGVDLPLANTEPGVAGLHLALQEDADGKPSGEVLTSAEVTVGKPVPGGSAWGSAALPAEFRFLPGVRYWLVLQSVSGEAYWDVLPGDPAAPALQASTDGGFSWRTAATDAGEKPLAALYRLRHRPERFSVPVQLQLGKEPDTVRVHFDHFAPLGRVEFDLDFAAELGEYLTSPAIASPCGSGDLLVNGDFADPPSQDDATRKLFGFDARRAVGSDAQPATLTGTVDLSAGFDPSAFAAIKISVDGGDAVEIAFAGEIPTPLTLDQIVEIINTALGLNIASHDNTHIILTSPSTGATSRLDFAIPDGADATADILGITSPAHYQGADAAPAQVIGTVDLSRGVDLSVERLITLSVDNRFPKLIDCAGAIPARTRCDEVVMAINDAMKMMEIDVATYDHRLIITSPTPTPTPTPGAKSAVELHAWCRPQVPDGWQGVPGRVLRTKGSEAGQFFVMLLAVRLASNPASLAAPPFAVTEQMIGGCFLADPAALEALTGEPAELSQRVPVVADCAYLLQFTFQVDFRGEVRPDPPRWEVEWLDADRESLDTDGGTLDFAAPSGSVEAPLTAPPGAVEADVRFVCPSPSWGASVLTLGEVAFVPTRRALRNGNFQQWEGEPGVQTPVGWTPLGGLLDPEPDETGQVIGTKLQGGGPEDAVLVQTAEVVGGERYELQVCAWPVPPPADDPETQPVQQRARLELHWLTDDDVIGEPVILPLDGRDFPIRAWTGTAPDGTTQAEIRLVQPQGRGNLVVESVSLSRADLVSVPLTFLAEAPGELTVSDLRVTYEPSEPPPELLPPQPTTRVAPQRRAIAPVPQPPVEPVIAGPPTPPVATPPGPPATPVAAPPLTTVGGIGEGRAQRLAEIGIDSLERLAAAAPEDVARVLRGVSVEMAAGFIEEARQLLASR